uniref:Membrane bound O-acyltransferase domain containing 1 n=1 Tax=Lepisosteus oculatus TaxID=7918 RepID=W5MR98_LEPOC
KCRMEDPQSFPYRTTGSLFLYPVSEFFGVPLDQVNFLACQLFALLAAFWFRLYLHPKNVSTTVRHAVAILLGIFFVIFCFGWYSAHIFILVFSCYYIMVKANNHNVHRYSLIVAMGYLTLCQVSRVYIFSYGILSTDFSGPLMIITQKITTLAFQLHDGLCRKAEQLTTEQRRLAVNSKPHLLEYLSYQLNFLSILVGPCSNYKDYIEFIEGTHVYKRLSMGTSMENNINEKQNVYGTVPEPSPVGAVIKKLLLSIGCLILFLSLTKALPISYNIDSQFINEASFLARLTYAFFSIQAARPKFYFAWTLADAISNAAGYGFSGVDKDGNFSWDLISNLNIWKIETATSFKMFIDNWNIQTGAWLKRVCYDRAPYYPTALTFVLSALWHGVYPGYYFTFITAIPITIAAKAVRKNFRHYFLSSWTIKIMYDILTWAVTQLAVCYTVMPFLLLAVEPTLTFYKSMYFHFHIIPSLIVLILPIKHRSHMEQKSHPSHISNNNIKYN